jgi:aspartyl-tRNA(Asn)/glutamyl-tRNA(Gln) amidotransferase subunit C
MLVSRGGGRNCFHQTPPDGEESMGFEIEKVADLARLRLKPAEKAKLEKDIGTILQYVKKLDSLKTEGVEPTSHVLNLENVFRPDEVHETDIRRDVLEHAPQREGDFFKVPKIVDKE